MTFKMPSEAHPVGLKLRVKELDRALTFYTGLLGLQQERETFAGEPLGSSGAGSAEQSGGVTSGATDRSNGVRLRLGAGLFFLDLEESLEAPVRPYPSVGLYHFALLLPDRHALALVFRKLVKAGWDFEGAADHGVSEAIYLRDPERNGIELYRDRPKDSWPMVEGRVAMVTEPLDLYGMLDEAPEPAPLDPQTRLGHMHLHVDDLSKAAGFYADALGLQNRASLPGAEFLAAGDYHHHVGLNTWAGSRRAPSEATGLVKYTWRVPAGTLEDLAQVLEAQGAMYRNGRNLVAADPIGIEVEFTEDT